MLVTISPRNPHIPAIRNQRAIVREMLERFQAVVSLYTKHDSFMDGSNQYRQRTRETWTLNKLAATRMFGPIALQVLPLKIEGKITECFYGSQEGLVDGRLVEFTPLTGRIFSGKTATEILRETLQKLLA